MSVVDRSHTRVKAMLIAPHPDGRRHLVSVNAPTSENPAGFHRLIGGGVELGETHREAIVREIAEELNAEVHDLRYLGTVENIFRYNEELGHEIVALYSGRLWPMPPDVGGVLTESNGVIVPVEWRPFDDHELAVPLYPAAVRDWLDHRGMRERPEIVCICGSSRFFEAMRQATRDLTLAGIIVLAPGEMDGPVSEANKRTLDALHLRKIDLADRVVVVNPGGYVGESTRREISYAVAAGKPVSFTERDETAAPRSGSR